MVINRFTELQAEFLETSARLQLAERFEEKRELLNELQRIVRDSKVALDEMARDSRRVSTESKSTKPK